METNDENSSVYLELCTDNPEDWASFLHLGVEGFHNSPTFKKTHPDPQKRRNFVDKYFKYIYDSDYSNGRAGLACVKKIMNGKSEIIYAFSLSYNRKHSTPADTSALMEIDQAAGEIQLREDEWYEKVIHGKMRRISDLLKFDYTFGNYHVVPEKYRSKGLSKRYFLPALEMLVQDGLERGLLNSNKPLVHFGIVDDVTNLKAQPSYGVTEIGHDHTPRLDDGTPVCINDSNSSQIPADNFDCVFTFAKQMSGTSDLVPLIQKMYDSSSNL